MASRTIKHTYGSRAARNRPLLPSSPRSSDTLFDSEPPTSPLKRKRPLEQTSVPSLYDALLQPSKKSRTKAPSVKKENRPATSSSKAKSRSLASSSSFTQLHLSLSNTTIRTCTLCNLSYTRGSPEDERLHKGHCQRVTRGMEWSREEERASGVQVLDSAVRLKGGIVGRIIEAKADSKGKLGTKLSTLYDTINRTLSSPAIPSTTLAQSKAYIFLVPGTSSTREKIVGCVIATRIESAMKIVRHGQEGKDKGVDGLVWVDGEEGGLYCDPTPLPTPMGIPRIFVSSEFRHKGIASALLNAAAENFIHGCSVDPKLGEVAFSQPTGDGRGIMFAWGGGGVRIFEE